jgi:hypothetical protein
MPGYLQEDYMNLWISLNNLDASGKMDEIISRFPMIYVHLRQ